MKKQLTTLLLMPGILLSGCSAFRPMNQVVSITAWPLDSRLMVNGTNYPPPLQIAVRRDSEVNILCTHDGYVPYQHTIHSHYNGTAALDIVGTIFFLFPVIGLIAPGARSLDQTDVSIVLYKPGETPPPVTVQGDTTRYTGSSVGSHGGHK